MVSTTLDRKQWYRRSAEELRDGRDTEDAAKLHREIMTALRGGHTSREVLAELVRLGAAKDCAGRVVRRAMAEYARGMLDCANADFERGETDSSAVRWAIGVGRGQAADDPAVSNFLSRLEALGFSPALARFVAQRPEMREERRSTAAVWLALGFVFSAFGVWVFVTAAPADADRGKALFAVALGIGAAWKGLWALLHSRRK
jgi:hypothetical protein